MSKYTLEIITAHNGAEVLSIRNTAYIHTEFDDIMAAWREQERKRQQHQAKPKTKIIKLLRRMIA